MNTTELLKIRLVSQQIGETRFNNPKKILEWMGAIQAQDYAMAKWAVGVRILNSTDKVITSAIDNGDILRTHLLRPTWHFVSNDDIYWMLEMTAPRLRVSFKSRHNQLGLSKAILRKSNSIIEKALKGGNHLTREELIAELGKSKIATDENRASHLFAWAELEGLICSGATKRGKQTYAILEERAQKKKPFNKDEALSTLAKKYFTSRAPATLQDFVWWSGLSVSAAKHALEMVAPELIAEKIDSQANWVPTSFSMPKVNDERVYMLPAFDEYIISYKDRSAALPFETKKKAVSNNGIFRPVIVLNGQVRGIWKRTIDNDKVSVDVALFEPPSKSMRNLIEEASAEYGLYLEKRAELNIKF
ncbi:MAG: winged helix DNA-binding domain-containing protein [Anaerolineales bacterium]